MCIRPVKREECDEEEAAYLNEDGKFAGWRNARL